MFSYNFFSGLMQTLLLLRFFFFFFWKLSYLPLHYLKHVPSPDARVLDAPLLLEVGLTQ
jgi:hypothetical protein